MRGSLSELLDKAGEKKYLVRDGILERVFSERKVSLMDIERQFCISRPTTLKIIAEYEELGLVIVIRKPGLETYIEASPITEIYHRMQEVTKDVN